MWCRSAGDGIVMMARGPSLSTQFLHLMLIITQPIGTLEEVNNKQGPSNDATGHTFNFWYKMLGKIWELI